MRDLLELMRPAQWVKNAFVLAPLVFAQRFFEPSAFASAGAAVASFCFASSAAYVFNDMLDRKRDRLHPVKRERPIAARRVTVRQGAVLALALMAAAVSLAVIVGERFSIALSAFLLLQVAYSSLLKHVIVLDSMALALGFAIRAAAGVVAVGADMSPWLLVCTFLLALFLALGKRRHEIGALGGDAGAHREVLSRYSVALLDQLIVITSVATVVIYALYTMSAEVIAKLGTEHLYLTIPFVVFGVFRYLFLVYGREEGGSPTDLLLRDVPLQAGIAGWIAAVFWLLYR